MSLTNPNTPVSQQDLQDFYHKILPYMGGGSEGGGGHTIEDAEGIDLTQRDIMQFGTGFNATDDSENEKTVVEADVMQSGDMDDVITPLPSVAPKKEGIKYSTTEQVVGEWIDGKPIYQKSYTGIYGLDMNFDLNINNADKVIIITAGIILSTGEYIPHGAYTNPSNFLSFFITSDKTKCGIRSSQSFNNSTYYVTIQYTKTTDTPNT